MKLFLAPAFYLCEPGALIDGNAYRDRYLQILAEISQPCFKHWLVIPGAAAYRENGDLFNAATAFLGGAEVSVSVLQQNFAPGGPLPQARNAVFHKPHDPRVRAGYPPHRVDHFRPETGLRLGLEIDNDHGDGLLWNAFADDPDDLPDLQLVTAYRSDLIDHRERILANTRAVKPGGLLFGCRTSFADNQPVCRLYVYRGRGMYAPVRADTVLTGPGPVARYPSRPIPGRNEIREKETRHEFETLTTHS